MYNYVQQAYVNRLLLLQDESPWYQMKISWLQGAPPRVRHEPPPGKNCQTLDFRAMTIIGLFFIKDYLMLTGFFRKNKAKWLSLSILLAPDFEPCSVSINNVHQKSLASRFYLRGSSSLIKI
jgi:hypothetical protein